MCVYKYILSLSKERLNSKHHKFRCSSPTAESRPCGSFQIPRKSKQREAATTKL